MLADGEDNTYYIKHEIFERPVSERYTPILVRSKIFVIRHFPSYDQLKIMSFHTKTESEDQEKIEFTAMRNKFLQRPAYQVLPCRCTWMKEKTVMHRRVDNLEETQRDLKIKINGYGMNFKKQVTSPSKVYNYQGDDAPPLDEDEGIDIDQTSPIKKAKTAYKVKNPDNMQA